jgi:hypothetical protein
MQLRTSGHGHIKRCYGTSAAIQPASAIIVHLPAVLQEAAIAWQAPALWARCPHGWAVGSNLVEAGWRGAGWL